MTHVLYSFRRCPYAIRARMAIWQSGVAVELKEVSLRAKPAEMLALSPKGTVPVLRCTNGEVIDESLAIMHWALAQHDPADWLANARDARNKDLIKLNDGVFKQSLDRYKYFERYPEHTQTFYREQAVDHLINTLETVLSHHRYLTGHHASLTDVAIFPFVRQFAAVDLTWFEAAALPNTQRWLAEWLNSDLFLTVMRKHP